MMCNLSVMLDGVILQEVESDDLKIFNIIKKIKRHHSICKFASFLKLVITFSIMCYAETKNFIVKY